MPIAAAITTVWFVAGMMALYRSEVQVFLVASGPMGVLCGYVFGVSLMRRAENGNGVSKGG